MPEEKHFSGIITPSNKSAMAQRIRKKLVFKRYSVTSLVKMNNLANTSTISIMQSSKVATPVKLDNATNISNPHASIYINTSFLHDFWARIPTEDMPKITIDGDLITIEGKVKDGKWAYIIRVMQDKLDKVEKDIKTNKNK